MRLGCMECGDSWFGKHGDMRCPTCGAGETFIDDRGDNRGDSIRDLFDQVQASDQGETLSLAFYTDSGITASTESRTLGGTLVRYGVYGRTSRGRLRVRPGALRFHADLRRTILTREHDRDTSRGVLASVHDSAERMRVQLRAADGPEGDAALQEAGDGSRAGLSFDVVDATIVGDEITDALVIAIGQVGIPAYDDGRIDQIAANLNTGDTPMTPEQRARLAELAAMNSRTPEQDQEFQTLTAAAVAEVTQQQDPATPPAAPAPAAGDSVAASTVTASAVPAVPAGAPAPTSSTTTRPRGSALQALVESVTAGMASGSVTEITAALQDIIHTDHTANIEAPAWSGELWSGLQYVPEWTDLLTPGSLTNYEGRGWRFTSKLEIADYAGDKAAIPSGNVTTEDSSYEAARMAVGVDIDRKFYDFPNQGFVNSLFEQVRESWEIKLDAKVRSYILANAHAATRTASVTTTNADATVTAAAGTFSAADVGATITGAGIPAATTILSVTNSGEIELSANATAGATVTATIGVQAPTVLKAAARVSMDLKRRRIGRAGYVVVNDEDMFTLLDVAEKDVPVFLDLWGIEAKDFRSSPDVPRGTVIGGVKQAAVLRTLPGSPVRVSAQHLANGGVDEAFFGYWAIEEHHTSGIATFNYKAAA